MLSSSPIGTDALLAKQALVLEQIVGGTPPSDVFAALGLDSPVPLIHVQAGMYRS